MGSAESAWDGALLKSATTSGPFNASVGYSYDNNFWLTHLNAVGTIVDYGYDTDGLLTSAAVGTTNLSLTRDVQNGLLDATALGQVSDTWSYSPFAEPATYTASANGSAVFSTSFARDALGRITQKTETVLGATHTTVYGYDTAGRLTTVTIDTQPSAEYAYDSNSNRATHTVDTASLLLGKTIPCLGDLERTGDNQRQRRCARPHDELRQLHLRLRRQRRVAIAHRYGDKPDDQLHLRRTRQPAPCNAARRDRDRLLLII